MTTCIDVCVAVGRQWHVLACACRITGGLHMLCNVNKEELPPVAPNVPIVAHQLDCPGFFSST